MLKRRVINPIALILLIGLLAFNFFTPLPWWVFAITAFFWFLITVCGSFFIRWNYHLKSLHSNKTPKQNWVSITFDDGPNPEFTPKVLALLKKYNAKATFFCIGQQIKKQPEVFKEILANGHSIGNHTNTHSKLFGFFSFKKVVKELEDTITLVNEITGFQMKLYRPAFGVTNPSIQKAVSKLNLQSIGWNVRSLDTTTLSETKILHRITSKVSKGDIILLHDTSEKTIAVLEQLLLFLQQHNLEPVPVDQLLNIKAYA